MCQRESKVNEHVVYLLSCIPAPFSDFCVHVPYNSLLATPEIIQKQIAILGVRTHIILNIILHVLISIEVVNVWYQLKAHRFYICFLLRRSFKLHGCMVCNNGNTFHRNIFQRMLKENTICFLLTFVVWQGISQL